MSDENDDRDKEVRQAQASPGGTAAITASEDVDPVEQEIDDFGLRKRPSSRYRPASSAIESEDENDAFHDAEDIAPEASSDIEVPQRSASYSNGNNQKVGATANGIRPLATSTPVALEEKVAHMDTAEYIAPSTTTVITIPLQRGVGDGADFEHGLQDAARDDPSHKRNENLSSSPASINKATTVPVIKREKKAAIPAVSEWSHQRLAPPNAESEDESEEETWQAMPALGEYDIYDDDGRLVAKANKADNEEVYAGIGGAGKGYTRVVLDEDAKSATSMDDDTNYLFKEGQRNVLTEEDEQRDAATQLEATKDLLTEGQRIAYVGVARLTVYNMVKELEEIEKTKATKKDLVHAFESMEKWGQKMMVRLYGHMEIDSAEQIMIEQLAEHGVQPSDLAPPLMQNSRVRNPMADLSSPAPSQSPQQSNSTVCEKSISAEDSSDKDIKAGEDVPEVQSPDDMTQAENIDLDLRWTVLCDLFLVLISDSIYDARSRLLLERVASVIDISWIQICRFEKRVMDALEMQEEASRENWDEGEHVENRRKMGLRRKYMVMGIATVGGGLVIGLSAGLLAPVIGAGLAAGFTTIGVTGTAGFLGGIGGAALITSAATAAGGTIAVRASNRRTGHVKTFEYRPLHNNKRLNLILTVSGWMNGKVDDVRLPYSTVDPIMGDIYSLLWEPEMLRSMGDTINILATEALTQTVQQVLGSTILVALMASLQLPIVLTKLSYLIDNPWTVSLDRANSAGQILADSLIDRHLGQRPITLVGFSLGSRLIFSCLKELANRGAYGLIQNVYLFGSPIVNKKDEYLRARSIISGRFVNGYASNDWILGYLFRATSGGIMRISGLAPVEDVPGLENIDVTSLVNGHMAYRAAMPRLLREVGWEVESDEFTEIEDPDPENHEQRQRELIQEIDGARRKAEEQPNKRRFGFFRRGMLADKKGWETYENHKGGHSRTGSDNSSSPGLDANVLFDIDAIRRELESEMIEVRELDSTLPPMQISTLANGEKKSQPLPLPPSDLQPDEIARMKLPPRPEELEESHSPLHSRLHSENSFHRAPTPSRMPEPEFDLGMPRELKTTLPPLKLTPSLPQETFRPTPIRPDLKTYATTPSGSDWSAMPISPTRDVASPVEALNLEHNAWADDADLGKEKEVKMTFE